jgi:Cdc6-like AAA superfamily ATPase
MSSKIVDIAKCKDYKTRVTTISLGEIYDAPSTLVEREVTHRSGVPTGTELTISSDILNHSAFMTGTSGSGKTVLARKIMWPLYQAGFNVVAIDDKAGLGKNFPASDCAVVTPSGSIGTIPVDVLATLLRSNSPAQERMIVNAITLHKMKGLPFYTYAHFIEALKKTPAKNATYEILLNQAIAFGETDCAKCFNSDKEFITDSLFELGTMSVIKTLAFKDPVMKAFILSCILDKLTSLHADGDNESPFQRLIVWDELNQLCNDPSKAVKRILHKIDNAVLTLRSTGTSFLFIGQLTNGISDTISGLPTRIIFETMTTDKKTITDIDNRVGKKDRSSWGTLFKASQISLMTGQFFISATDKATRQDIAKLVQGDYWQGPDVVAVAAVPDVVAVAAVPDVVAVAAVPDVVAVAAVPDVVAVAAVPDVVADKDLAAMGL